MSSKRLRSCADVLHLDKSAVPKVAVEVSGDQQPAVGVVDVPPCADLAVRVPGESVHLMADPHH